MGGRRLDFYRSGLAEFIPDRDANILVCAAGPNDRNVFHELGYRRVTMTNLDTRLDAPKLAPYEWKRQDAQALDFPDGSFDYAVTHASLHHCRSPHRALLEMYRVARVGVLVFESRDSFTMRLMQRLGVTLSYEDAAVFYNNCQYGGVDNTQIPNFVYRWTEREVEKTISSFDPTARHRIHFRYWYLFPQLARLERAWLKYLALRLAVLPYLAYVTLFPRQRNRFCFYIEKPTLPDALQPWLEQGDGGEIVFKRAWGEARFKGALPPDD